MSISESPLVPAFLIFCRVGGCLMTAPGFSSERVPLRMRLYLSIAFALSLAPLLMERLSASFHDLAPSRLLGAILTELTIGVALGLLARVYFLALETLTTSVAMTFGLGNIFGAPVTEQEPMPALATFITTCALTLVFLTDGHLEIIRALFASYEAAPLFEGAAPGGLLDEIIRALTKSHVLALRICSPFLLFGLIVNVGLGMLSRLTPQIQVYFIASPLVIFLGVYAISILYADFFAAFAGHFVDFLHD